MADHDETGDDIDVRIKELSRSVDEFRQRCLVRSAMRVAQECARLARSQQRLIPYMEAKFNVMNQAQTQLEPELGKEVAVELIALLENEDRARLLQPDFPEDEYFHTVSWMSACAYDNLAKHVAKMQGCNSEGMHACISDGIEVCRRTGKLRCITCFREYATDVYSAADDLDMALHFARLVQALPKDAPNSERRWVGAKDETWLQLLLGDLDAAQTVGEKALALAETYHTPLEARLDSRLRMDVVRLLQGAVDPRDDAAFAPRDLPAKENTAHDLEADYRDALRACCASDYERAVSLLEPWDRLLGQKKCLSTWLETRLRLIAVHRVSGQNAKIDALVNPLVERAKKARDWLTLRRLARLLDPEETPSPLALLGPLKAGPYAAIAAATLADSPAAPSATAPQPQEPAPALTPMQNAIQGFVERLNAARDNRDELDDGGRIASIGADIIAIDPAHITDPTDAAWLMYLLLHAATAPGANLAAVWSWTGRVAAAFGQQAAVLNLQAAMGDLLRDVPDSPLRDAIDVQDLDRWFRQSLDLDPFNPRAHARAGDFYLRQENLGEAERCLARGFRLARNDAFLALKLAEVYDRTERPRDALAVLDLCLREGGDSPDVAWQAALKAQQLGQYESLLAYCNRFDELVPDQPWTNYYRTLAYLETNRPLDALQALDAEERIAPSTTLPVAVLRACARSMLQAPDEFRMQLARVLEHRLADVDYMTYQGLLNLFGRLWQAAKVCPDGDPLHGELAQRMLAAGLASDEFFERVRQQNEETPGVNHYRCIIRQPLDAAWPSSTGCLPAQKSWQSFHQAWGVLASSEEEASQCALDWQGRSFSTPAEVVACELLGENFTDKPGVVWQSERWSADPDETS